MGDSIKDLVVLVTGASSGIGVGIAVEFAKCGAKLVLNGRNQERLQQTRDECIKQGLAQDNLFVVAGDVTVEEDVKNIVESCVQHYGRLDVLVNNAGATRARQIDVCEIDDLDFCYNALVKSVFLMSKAALPHLQETKGAVINMSSLAGLRPYPFAVPYSMAKYAVDRLTQIMADSPGVAGKGVRVNAVCPASVNTELFSKPGGPGTGDPGALKRYLDWCCRAIPLGRLGEIDEVARLVVFLASDNAKFLNGTLFPIDGSYSNTSFIPKPGQARFEIAKNN